MQAFKQVFKSGPIFRVVPLWSSHKVSLTHGFLVYKLHKEYMTVCGHRRYLKLSRTQHISSTGTSFHIHCIYTTFIVTGSMFATLGPQCFVRSAPKLGEIYTFKNQPFLKDQKVRYTNL